MQKLKKERGLTKICFAIVAYLVQSVVVAATAVSFLSHLPMQDINYNTFHREAVELSLCLSNSVSD